MWTAEVWGYAAGLDGCPGCTEDRCGVIKVRLQGRVSNCHVDLAFEVLLCEEKDLCAPGGGGEVAG